jgi:hypothetical protein
VPGVVLGVADAITDLLRESQVQSLKSCQHVMVQVERSCGCQSTLINQCLRKLCNWADASQQVAMLKRGARVRDSVAHIQTQRNAATGQMPVQSCCCRAQQLPKLAAAACRDEQAVKERCDVNVSMLAIRITTDAKVRTSCLEHKAKGAWHRICMLDNLCKIAS